MIGTIVNVCAILLGGCLGLLFKRLISEKLGNGLMLGIGLCILYISVNGSLNAGDRIVPSDTNDLVLIISMVLGGLVGYMLKLDYRMNRIGDRLRDRLAKGDSKSSVSEAFVTASLLYCVGAMAIVGSLQSGLDGNHSTLFTKSMLDGLTAMVLGSQLGFGILFAAVPVFVYQGAITLAAHFVEPFLSDLVIAEMSCIGYVIIIGIGLNMLKITKLKVMNYVPGIFIAGIIAFIADKISVIYNFLY